MDGAVDVKGLGELSRARKGDDCPPDLISQVLDSLFFANSM